jgi:hypothetical protein
MDVTWKILTYILITEMSGSKINILVYIRIFQITYKRDIFFVIIYPRYYFLSIN